MSIPVKVERIVRQNAREVIYERLLEWIIDGTLAPGEVIRDLEIAELFGVSRTPVREAIQQLEQLGTIETQPGRSTRVTEIKRSDAPAIYSPLAVLHALAAEQMTTRATEADLDALTGANELFCAAVNSADAMLARRCDAAFHAIVVAGADNRYLRESIERLSTHAQRLEVVYFSQLAPFDKSCAEHAQIIEAIRAKDARKASQLTERQWRRTVNVLTAEE